MKAIASRDNPAYKSVAKLMASAAERRRSGLSVLDGAHLLLAWMLRGDPPEQVLVSPEAATRPEVAAVLARLEPRRVVLLSAPLMESLSTVETATGVITVVPTPQGRPVPGDADLVLLLDQIQDPGNVGTLLRSAAGAGAAHVVLSPHCAFAWSPKVLRAGMGAHFALNIVEGADLAGFLLRFRGTSVALAGGAAGSLYGLDLRGPVAVVVGNEGAGLSAAVLEAAGHRARIPTAPAVESLNAGVAGAIALFEVARQRTMGR